MLITDPKIYTEPQYRHPHVQAESVPGMWEQEQTAGAGLGGTSRSCQLWNTGMGLGTGEIPNPWQLPGPAARRRYGCARGARRAPRDGGSCRTGAEGLMQGRCCQAALWLCQHSKVSWHKTHGKDLSQQSTTNSPSIFLASPKISQPFCSSCLLGLENTSIFNLKDILIICFPF